jgi:dipeptidyl aminopeptidase/acylaminoacyl peptidase
MKNLILLCFITISLLSSAQNNLNYQSPPKEILELADAAKAPAVLMNENKEHMLLLYKNTYKSIQELSQPEVRLGGLRINPKTNIESRTTYFNNIKTQSLQVKSSAIIQVKGLPENPQLSNFSWSPDQSKMAMTHTSSKGVEIWVLDIKTSTIKKITEATVNANVKDVINWFKDGESILVKFVPKDKKDLIETTTAIPGGPTISENDGKKAQNRTYQDLLKNKNDEFNFEQLALSELFKVRLDGTKENWLESDLYKNISFSPDGEYVMVSTIKKPFSYLVPYYRFPSETTIYTKDAEMVKTVLSVPLIEDLPKGFMSVRTGRRDLAWRADKPSSLIYAEALDNGDPAVEVDFRDEVFQLDAPFDGDKKSILKTINRFGGIEWANETTAIAYDYWWNTRNTKTYLFNPSSSDEPIILNDRNYQDKYSAPGEFVTHRNEYGKNVISLHDDNAYLLGDGFSDKGQFPFLDQLNLKTQKKSRLYQSVYTDKLESIDHFDTKKQELLVRIESSTEYPNYYFRKLKNKKLEQITAFGNPFKSIEGIHKEVIKYQREDGIELSGTLYLPVGYDMTKKEKVPMILWAYPTEFKDKSSAAQTTSNPNKFTYLYWASPIFWVTRGYAVLDKASFPIIGEGDEEPNDSFRTQLVANAKAAIDAVDSLGYIDRDKVAVGGHSYGAFMVANLLTHSDLFAAGIARSGAYNRTLTPFGFQAEERNYWEAPEVYYNMSPFMHSEKMKHALLLIHGEADNNSGTYPMQSERYFNALKGLGATVRLVILPKESHSYKARENIMHMLWEQDQWLEKYVKHRE